MNKRHNDCNNMGNLIIHKINVGRGGQHGEKRENVDGHHKTWTVVSKERNVLVDVLNADPEIVTDVDTSIVPTTVLYCGSDEQRSQVTMKAECNARSSVLVQMRMQL